MDKIGGKCKCKTNHNISKVTECKKFNKTTYSIPLLNQYLSNFLKCKFMGKNSKCDQEIKRCDCEFGYSYDLKLNKCVHCRKKEGNF